MGFFDFLFGKDNKSDNKSGTNTQQSGTSSSLTVVPGGAPSRKDASPTTNKPKKSIETFSIDEIYGKGFRFVVDGYEEWANQRCTNQGEMNGEIVAEVVGDRIIFTLSGFERLNIVKTLSMDLSNPQSMVLKSEDGVLITSDRIQYLANNINSLNTPYICHLFYENGRISYVRFGFLHPNSSLYAPFPSRIYEFYGDMVELTGVSKSKASSNGFTPFVFRSTCHQRY